MAGLKETPRQKMIGMMYLVLTAILALQVSSSLLDKFTLLNRSLEAANGSANEKNQKQNENIKAEASKKIDLYGDIIKKADQVRQLSNTMISELETLKTEIVTKSGGLNEEGNIKNPSEEEQVSILMVGQNKSGKAYALKNRLNTWVTDLTKFADPGTQLAPLAVDGKDDPISSKNAEQKNKDFAELNFAQTPVPAALATLSQKQSEVRRYEATILDQLAAKVGAKEVKFDKIFGMISAKSNTVVAGTPFEAEMFIAASSSAITPRMTFNGGPVQMEDGKGKIKFIAQGGAYDSKGLARKTYSGAISYQDPSGQMKSINVDGEYFVAKPSYTILTSSMPGLYLGCQNKLEFVSPAMGQLWQPSFSGSGGDISSNGGGKVTIVPSASKVALNVINQGQNLGVEEFKVQRVPRPEVVVTCNGGTPINFKQGMPASQIRSIEVNCIPPDGFKITNPDDAKYRATDITVFLALGTKKLGSVQFEKAGSVSGLAAQAQSGARYVIEVKGVKRSNFKGEISDMGMQPITLTVPLN